ncbi:MAG: sigma-54 dependent transcriptional regulator [Candidatus Aerophobetes bacterium]|nr:sigma-54 dependent transcriptional regulator [Candidatus Aerophobetes bacterium]
MNRVLVVEDNKNLRELIYQVLKDSYKIFQAEDRPQACQLIEKTPVDLVLLDLHLPPAVDTPEEGMRALEEIKKINPEIKVMVITGNKEKETSLRAINNGAYDYLSKPFDLEKMEIVIERALYIQSLERENQRLHKELSQKVEFANIIGKSNKMRSVFEMMRIVAQSGCNVLIRGESGTGKELVARTIHYNGPRQNKPFVAVNCAAIPEALLESELFGYEKGAFTDATRSKPGKFEIASGGTLFLDEIADMSSGMQAKILRAIQERTFERLGGTRPIKVDTRLIAATNKNLEELMMKEAFRQDLYYRLNVVSIYLPALREKKEDIPLLVNHFLRKYNRIDNKKIKGVSTEALKLLMDYDWPGNVRELENTIERAIVLGQGEILLAKDISLETGKEPLKSRITSSSMNISLAEAEKRLIQEVLKTTHWNQAEAAKLLGVHRNTLRRKIKYFKIHQE